MQRNQQATVLNAFVKQVLAADKDANVVLAGDFNDYQFSTSMQTLTDNGATLTDLITTLPENQRYTYVFNGVSQVLDHIFMTKPVTDVEYQVIHNNAEFADQASDHDPQLVRIRPTIRQGTLTLDPATVTVPGATTVRLCPVFLLSSSTSPRCPSPRRRTTSVLSKTSTLGVCSMRWTR